MNRFCVSFENFKYHDFLGAILERTYDEDSFNFNGYIWNELYDGYIYRDSSGQKFRYYIETGEIYSPNFIEKLNRVYSYLCKHPKIHEWKAGLLADFPLIINHFEEKLPKWLLEKTGAKMVASLIRENAWDYAGHPTRNFAENLSEEDIICARSLHKEALLASYEKVDNNISEEFTGLKLALRYELVFTVNGYQSEILEARNSVNLPMSPASLLTNKYLSFGEKAALASALKLGY